MILLLVLFYHALFIFKYYLFLLKFWFLLVVHKSNVRLAQAATKSSTADPIDQSSLWRCLEAFVIALLLALSHSLSCLRSHARSLILSARYVACACVCAAAGLASISITL